MKKITQLVLPLLALVVTGGSSLAQSQLAPDQNPNYLVSQNRYMGISDSLTSFQSTTVQDTYKAIDYLEDKKEARALRKAYRQQRRLDSWGNSWGNNWGYDNFYPNYGYNNYGFYNQFHSWSGRPYLNNFLFNTVPLTFMLGNHRRWWR